MIFLFKSSKIEFVYLSFPNLILTRFQNFSNNSENVIFIFHKEPTLNQITNFFRLASLSNKIFNLDIIYLLKETISFGIFLNLCCLKY